MGKLGLKIKLLQQQQRKIYLLELIDALKKALPSTSPTDWEVPEEEEDNEGAAINEVLRINQRLSLLYQSRKDLYIDRSRSPIIAQILIDDRNGRLWGHFRRHCEIGGGCCARGCGCCEKPRRPRYEPNYPTVMKRSHCTVTCGCCVQYRGFYALSDEYSKFDRAWSLGWILNPMVCRYGVLCVVDSTPYSSLFHSELGRYIFTRLYLRYYPSLFQAYINCTFIYK